MPVGYKMCPKCKQSMLTGRATCVKCGHVFFHIVNGVNLYDRKRPYMDQCPQCKHYLYINMYSRCGCGNDLKKLRDQLRQTRGRTLPTLQQ